MKEDLPHIHVSKKAGVTKLKNQMKQILEQRIPGIRETFHYVKGVISSIWFNNP